MNNSKPIPAKDLTLRDVVNHMNRKFSSLETKMNAGFKEVDRRFTEVDRRFTEVRVELRIIRKELKVEQSLVNTAFKRLYNVEQRTGKIERHLSLA